jgi:hypothetical protein
MARLDNGEKDREAEKLLPRIGEPVWVQCDGFRCAGMLETNGTWVSYYSGERLPEVLNWMRL